MAIAALSTDIIELAVQAGQAVSIPHGLGRQIAGYLVVWRSAPTTLYVQDPSKDTSKELVLVPTATASVRLVLL